MFGVWYGVCVCVFDNCVVCREETSERTKRRLRNREAFVQSDTRADELVIATPPSRARSQRRMKGELRISLQQHSACALLQNGNSKPAWRCGSMRRANEETRDAHSKEAEQRDRRDK
jgi:hypothetical protein